MISKVILVCVAAVTAFALPQGYLRQAAPYRIVRVAEPRNVYRPTQIIKQEIVESPEPYEMSFSIKDEFGNTQSRQESGDAHGNKQGGYSITDVNGISRQVSYIADDNGARFVIKTNEPGTSSDNPAGVEIDANPIEVVRSVAAPKQFKRIVLQRPGYY